MGEARETAAAAAKRRHEELARGAPLDATAPDPNAPTGPLVEPSRRHDGAWIFAKPADADEENEGDEDDDGEGDADG